MSNLLVNNSGIKLSNKLSTIENVTDSIKDQIDLLRSDTEASLRDIHTNHAKEIKNIKNQIKNLKDLTGQRNKQLRSAISAVDKSITSQSLKFTKELDKLSNSLDGQLKELNTSFDRVIKVQNDHHKQLKQIRRQIDTIYDFDHAACQSFSSVIKFGTLKVYSNHRFNKFTKWLLKKLFGMFVYDLYPTLLLDGATYVPHTEVNIDESKSK